MVKSQAFEHQTLEEAENYVMPELDYRPLRYLRSSRENKRNHFDKVPANNLSAQRLTFSLSWSVEGLGWLTLCLQKASLLALFHSRTALRSSSWFPCLPESSWSRHFCGKWHRQTRVQCSLWNLDLLALTWPPTALQRGTLLHLSCLLWWAPSKVNH